MLPKHFDLLVFNKITKLDLYGFTRMLLVSDRRLRQGALQMSSVKWVSNWLATDSHKETLSGFN